MKLTNPTDYQLDAAVAEKVAGWKRIPAKGEMPEMWDTGTDCLNQGAGYAWRVPRFTHSADAVLPWLVKKFAVFSYHSTREDGELCCDETYDYKRLIVTHGPFPRAAVIALLRAHGVEVEFTP